MAPQKSLSPRQLLNIFTTYLIITVWLVDFCTPTFTAQAATLATPTKLTEHVLSESPAGRLAPRPAPAPDQIVKVTLSAYTSSVEETDSSPDIAATGQKVYDGMVAANWLPFGTVIKIPSLFGDKKFIVADRMNERYGYGYVDIYFPSSRTEARRFGIRHRSIEIYFPHHELARK